MKIRTVALGVVFAAHDFSDVAEQSALLAKLTAVAEHLRVIGLRLSQETGHEVQTLRVYCNTFEEWLLPLLLHPYNMSLESIVGKLDSALDTVGIQLCSIGSCHSDEAIELVPKILALSSKLSCSVLFRKEDVDSVCPDFAKCITAARACLEVAKLSGDLGNFRFCTSFHCPEGIPFFPAAYRKSHNGDSDLKPLLTIGLENGDILHQAFYGTPETCGKNSPHVQGRENLRDLMKDICVGIQRCALSLCEERDIIYGGELFLPLLDRCTSDATGAMSLFFIPVLDSYTLHLTYYIGIDASMNPGLSSTGSVGAGLESLLPVRVEGQDKLHCFGAMGTLATVSTATIAIKSLVNCEGDVYRNGYQWADATTPTGLNNASEYVKLVGYSGLMLPVMEDHILAQRASEGRFTMRDLLTFSAVCGVGLDTVPIPGDTSAEALAGVYQEVATLAFRLNKPLSCRVLPMHGKKAGDVTDVVSPYLCNTKVFALP